GDILHTEYTLPSSDFRRLGLVSALLAQANSSGVLATMDCSPDDADCRAMDDIHSSFVALVNTALTRADSDHGMPRSGFWMDLSLQKSPGFATALWKTTRRIGRHANAAADFQLDDCALTSAGRSNPRLRG